MKVGTHVKLAELALNNIKVIPEGFSKFMFNFGLVMVDSSWHVKIHPHYMKQSLKYVIEKIEELALIKKFNGYYSMQLGIVIHYLCDFCCNAHITGSVGNIPNHLRYERELQRYLLDNYNTLKSHFNNHLSNKMKISNGLTSLKTSIENVLDNYMKSKPSYLLDIENCVQITAMVCSNVFELNMGIVRNTPILVKQLQA